MPKGTFLINFDRLQIIALLTIIIDGAKLGVAVSDIFTGHLQNLDSVMKRVFIHSVLLCILGSLGIICSVLFFIKKLHEQRSSIIIFWICQKGLGVFHQIFFALDIIFAVNENTHSSALRMVVILALITVMIIDVLFLIFIIKYYQSVESIQDESKVTRPNYLTQLSISRLFGDSGSPTSISSTDPMTLAASLTESNANNSNA